MVGICHGTVYVHADFVSYVNEDPLKGGQQLLLRNLERESIYICTCK